MNYDMTLACVRACVCVCVLPIILGVDFSSLHLCNDTQTSSKVKNR